MKVFQIAFSVLLVINVCLFLIFQYYRKARVTALVRTFPEAFTEEDLLVKKYYFILAFLGSFCYLSQSMTKPTIRPVTIEDSDQPAHLCSLIRVSTDHICRLQPPG